MSPARQVFAAIMLGLFIRNWRGLSMIDPFFLIPFACLSALLAGPTLAALRRKNPAYPVLLQVAQAVVRSCGSIAIMLGLPLIILNYPWTETWLLPEWPTALEAVLLSLAAATAAAALTALLMSRFGPAAVKWTFRALMLAALIAWWRAPGDWYNTTVRTVMDWGITTTALSTATALVAADAAILYLLARRPAIS